MRQWIKLVESVNYFREIDYSINEGSVEGYVVDSGEEQLDNWLSYRHHINEPELVEQLKETYSRIAFLNNINVEEEYQGQGFGAHLLETFISESDAYGAEAILLIADTEESQRNDFYLVKWYESWGFKVLHATSHGGPLMISDLRR
jgi:ribosomal protein S18 acetylase RimI-like enzyme